MNSCLLYTSYFSVIQKYDAKQVAELHRLSWNLGEAPLLFVVTPDEILIYNNYETPQVIENEMCIRDRTAGILIAIICVLVVWFFLEKTTMGYELKAVGLNKRGSTCNGISVMKNIVLSAFLSGGLSAVAGGIEVLAIQKKLLEGISSNCGYTAVLIALVAFNNPIGVFLSLIHIFRYRQYPGSSWGTGRSGSYPAFSDAS